MVKSDRISPLQETDDWGGICGKATTTAGIDATAEVGGFIYGGNEDNDKSGTIKNTRYWVTHQNLNHNITAYTFKSSRF